MISFCIITDGQEPAKLDAEIASIRALNVPEHEIIVCGDVSRVTGVDLAIPAPGVARQGRLGALRQMATNLAGGDVVVVADDDMLFDPGWYAGLLKFGDDWDVLSCKILNPDGTRYWDWKAHQNGKNWLLDYGEKSPLVSLTGGLAILKAYVLDKAGWDTERGFNQAEDVDFTEKIKMTGFRIDFNPHSTIVHDSNYTQIGAGVFRKEAVPNG
jgi:hypothetical protein